MSDAKGCGHKGCKIDHCYRSERGTPTGRPNRDPSRGIYGAGVTDHFGRVVISHHHLPEEARAAAKEYSSLTETPSGQPTAGPAWWSRPNSPWVEYTDLVSDE